MIAPEILAAGKRYEVTAKNRHPLRVGRRMVIIGESASKSEACFDRYDVVPPENIGLEPIVQAL